MDGPDPKNPHRVDTDGGAYIEGKVDTGGGEFVGRDKYVGYTSDQVSALLSQITSAFSPKPFDGRCPYLGLDAFDEDDADRFFGREKLVDELVSRIKAVRFVVIAGPSGSGKSSLVRAGLIHKLKQGALAGSDRWLYESLKPGPSPLEELARVMAGLVGSLEAGNDIRMKGLKDATILSQWAEIALKDRRDRRLVIFVDQFEETFTQVAKEQERIAFLNLLTHAATVENGRVTVLFALRSDFVSNCATYPQMNALLNQQFLQVGAMQPDELVSAIARPALQVGLQIDPDLIAQIMNDMQDEPGALPLMQFALKDLFDAQQAQGGVIALTLVEYLDRGGLRKALERHADAQFAKLNEEEQKLARDVFAGLIQVGRGTQDTRRTALFSELVPMGANAGTVKQVVDRLATARLITTDEKGDQETVTLSHERLIDAWSWLRKLVNENRDAIAFQNQIAEDAREWDTNKRDASYLYTGARLGTVREQLDAKKILLSGLAQEFVDAGIRAQEAERGARQRRVQLTIAGLATALVIISVFAIVAFLQQNIARSREKAALAIIQLNIDPKQSVLLALDAINSADTSEAETALRRSLVEDRLITILSDNDSWISSAAFSRDGTKILIASEKSARILNANTYEVIAELSGHKEKINSASFSPDGQFVFTASADKTARIWDLKRCHPDCASIELIGHEQGVLLAIFNPNGTQVATVSKDKSVRIWDVSTGRHLLTLGDKPIFTLISYSPDGKQIAASGEDYSIYLFDSTTGQLLHSLQGHTKEISSFGFNSDGQFIASGSRDNTARIWDTTNGAPLKELKGHTDRITRVSFSSDNQLVLTASADQTARVWDWRNEKLVSELRGHTGSVNSAVFSRDMKLVLTASADYTARLWETFSGHSVAVLRGHANWVYSASFDPLENRIMTFSPDRTARLWNADPAAGVLELRGHTLDINSSAVSPDGKYVVTASADFSARVWEVASGHVIAILSGHLLHINRVSFSPDGRFVVTASEDSTARIWDIANCRPDCRYNELKGHQLGVKSARFSPNGNYIITASNDQTARVWERATGRVIHEFSHNDWVWDAAFSPDGRFIVTASAASDPVATVWDLKTDSQVVRLEGHKDTLTSASFSPDGLYIVTSSRDGTVRVWDWKLCQKQTNCLFRELKGSKWFLEAAFSPDGNWIVTASEDRTARVWEWKTGKLISVIDEHTGAVNSSVFGPNNQFLITSSSDGTARIWPRASFVPFQEVIEIACQQVEGVEKPVVRKLCSTRTEGNQP